MGFTFFIQRSKAKERSIVKLIIWLLTIKTCEIKNQKTFELIMWYRFGKFFSRGPTLISVAYLSKFSCKIYELTKLHESFEDWNFPLLYDHCH
jgi:hypothetical protein